MLTLNLNLLYTVVNVLVLFLLLRKFLYKPVMNIIAQRQKQVDDALAAAETSKKRGCDSSEHRAGQAAQCGRGGGCPPHGL